MKKIIIAILLTCSLASVNGQGFGFNHLDSTGNWPIPDGSTGGHMYGKGRVLFSFDTSLLRLILGSSYITNGTSLQSGNYNISGVGKSAQLWVQQAAIGANPPNNSFEDPILSSNSYSVGAPTGYTSSFGLKIYPPSAYASPTAVDGNQTYAIETAGYFQTTSYAPGAGTWRFSIYIRYSGTKRVQITVDGNVIYNDSTFTSSFVKYTSDYFTVGAGNHTLKVETFGSGTVFFDLMETVNEPAVYLQKWVKGDGSTAMLIDSAGHIFVPGAAIASGLPDSVFTRNTSTGEMELKAVGANEGIGDTHAATLSAVANVSGLTDEGIRFTVNGNVLTISGTITLTTTSTTTASEIGVSIPAAYCSSIADVDDISGQVAFKSAIGNSGWVEADIANQRVTIKFTSGAATSTGKLTFTCSMIINNC